MSFVVMRGQTIELCFRVSISRRELISIPKCSAVDFVLIILSSLQNLLKKLTNYLFAEIWQIRVSNFVITCGSPIHLPYGDSLIARAHLWSPFNQQWVMLVWCVEYIAGLTVKGNELEAIVFRCLSKPIILWTMRYNEDCARALV